MSLGSLNMDNWPFVEITFPAIFNDETYKTHIDNVRAPYKKCMAENSKNSMVQIFNMEKLAMPAVKYIVLQAQEIKSINKLSEKYLDRSLILCPNEITKTLVKMIFFLDKPVRPCLVFSSKEELKSYLEENYKN